VCAIEDLLDAELIEVLVVSPALIAAGGGIMYYDERRRKAVSRTPVSFGVSPVVVRTGGGLALGVRL
jgi:hypothetical protein